MIQQLAKNVQDTKFLWEDLLYKTAEQYDSNSSFCNNIQFRGAYIVAAVIATVEVVACLAATIFTGLAHLLTCCKYKSLKQLTEVLAIRTQVNGIAIPSSIVGAIVHPNLGLFGNFGEHFYSKIIPDKILDL